MHANTPLLFAGLLIMLSVTDLFGSEPSKALSKGDVLALLPIGTDLEDSRIQKQYQELLACGEASHQALNEIANESDSRAVLSAVLSVLESTGRNSALARRVVCNIFKRFRNAEGNDARAIRINAVQVLGTIGTKDDVPLLLLLLDNNEEFLRTNAVRSLSKLGDNSTALQIGDALKKVSERPHLGSLERRRVLEERDAALQVIQKRMQSQGDSKKPRKE